MRRMAKADLLGKIRTQLMSLQFAHTGDRELDIIHAGNQVLRQNGVEYRSGMFTPAIETLTSPVALVTSGNRVSRSIEVSTTVHQDNGEIMVTLENEQYSVPVHRTKSERAFKAPKWSLSLLHVRAHCQSFEHHRRFNPPVVPVTPNTYRYHVNGGFDYNESRSIAVIAKARACVAENETAAAAAAAVRKAERDEMRRENPPQAPVIPAVSPSPVFGATFARIRPRAKWFLSNPPVMVRVAGGSR